MQLKKMSSSDSFGIAIILNIPKITYNFFNEKDIFNEEIFFNKDKIKNKN